MGAISDFQEGVQTLINTIKETSGSATRTKIPAKMDGEQWIAIVNEIAKTALLNALKQPEKEIADKLGKVIDIFCNVVFRQVNWELISKSTEKPLYLQWVGKARDLLKKKTAYAFNLLPKAEYLNRNFLNGLIFSLIASSYFSSATELKSEQDLIEFILGSSKKHNNILRWWGAVFNDSLLTNLLDQSISSSNVPCTYAIAKYCKKNNRPIKLGSAYLLAIVEKNGDIIKATEGLEPDLTCKLDQNVLLGRYPYYLNFRILEIWMAIFLQSETKEDKALSMTMIKSLLEQGAVVEPKTLELLLQEPNGDLSFLWDNISQQLTEAQRLMRAQKLISSDNLVKKHAKALAAEKRKIATTQVDLKQYETFLSYDLELIAATALVEEQQGELESAQQLLDSAGEQKLAKAKKDVAFYEKFFTDYLNKLTPTAQLIQNNIASIVFLLRNWPIKHQALRNFFEKLFNTGSSFIPLTDKTTAQFLDELFQDTESNYVFATKPLQRVGQILALWGAVRAGNQVLINMLFKKGANLQSFVYTDLVVSPSFEPFPRPNSLLMDIFDRGDISNGRYLDVFLATVKANPKLISNIPGYELAYAIKKCLDIGLARGNYYDSINLFVTNVVELFMVQGITWPFPVYTKNNGKQFSLLLDASYNVSLFRKVIESGYPVHPQLPDILTAYSKGCPGINLPGLLSVLEDASRRPTAKLPAANMFFSKSLKEAEVGAKSAKSEEDKTEKPDSPR